jgi:hypothetical protein
MHLLFVPLFCRRQLLKFRYPVVKHGMVELYAVFAIFETVGNKALIEVRPARDIVGELKFFPKLHFSLYD